MEDGNPKDPRQETLEKINREIETITDGLGMEIDPGIRETVQFLKANGFETYASCEGHLDNGLPYPWVDVGSLLKNNERFQELERKIDFEKETSTLAPEERKEYVDMKRKEFMQNRNQKERLTSLLEIFYEEQPSQKRENDLILSERGWNSVRLQSRKMWHEEPEEIRQKLSIGVLTELLESSQSEMRRFTEFLKNEFFNPRAEGIIENRRYERAFKKYSEYFSLTDEDLQKSILDVGASQGDFIQYVRKIAGNKNAYGVENQALKIDSATEGMIVGDGLQLPFANGTFQLVIARNYMPMFVEDTEERRTSLNELIRVTGSGGEIRCDISTPEREAEDGDTIGDTIIDEKENEHRKKRREGAQAFMSELEGLKEKGYSVEIRNNNKKNILTIKKP